MHTAPTPEPLPLLLLGLACLAIWAITNRRRRRPAQGAQIRKPASDPTRKSLNLKAKKCGAIANYGVHAARRPPTHTPLTGPTHLRI